MNSIENIAPLIKIVEIYQEFSRLRRTPKTFYSSSFGDRLKAVVELSQ